MNIDKQKPTLAARRAALVAECSRQRSEIGREMSNLRAPSVLSGGGGIMHGVMHYLSSGNLRVPLTIAGVVLGMIVTKPSRAMPLLATGLSLFKLVTSVLAVVRRPAG